MLGNVFFQQRAKSLNLSGAIVPLRLCSPPFEAQRSMETQSHGSCLLSPLGGRHSHSLDRSLGKRKEGNEHDFGQGAASQQASASLGQVQPEFDIAFEVERANLPEMRFV